MAELVHQLSGTYCGRHLPEVWPLTSDQWLGFGPSGNIYTRKLAEEAPPGASVPDSKHAWTTGLGALGAFVIICPHYFVCFWELRHLEQLVPSAKTLQFYAALPCPRNSSAPARSSSCFKNIFSTYVSINNTWHRFT